MCTLQPKQQLLSTLLQLFKRKNSHTHGLTVDTNSCIGCLTDKSGCVRYCYPTLPPGSSIPFSYCHLPTFPAHTVSREKGEFFYITGSRLLNLNLMVMEKDIPYKLWPMPPCISPKQMLQEKLVVGHRLWTVNIQIESDKIGNAGNWRTRNFQVNPTSIWLNKKGLSGTWETF